ncbi:MAG: hypothetical protein ACRDH2_02215 [Anaerolineales bacterium]
MMAKMGSVHEPEAPLLSAEDAIHDAERLREAYHRRKVERAVPVRVPLWALLEALGALEPDELRQVVRHVEERLATVENV